MKNNNFLVKFFLLLSFCLWTSILHNTTAHAQIINTIVGAGTSACNTGDGGPATAAGIGRAADVYFDIQTGIYYITEPDCNTVRKIDCSGTITIFAGTGTAGASGDGGPATAAELDRPTCITKDRSGNFYITDWNNNKIRKVDAAGVISTFAGTGTAGFGGDGSSATAAILNRPFGIDVDAEDNIVFVDGGNQRVRKITAGTISTICGNGTAGFSGDGGTSTSGVINNANYLAIDRHDNIYITDNGNSRIRKIDPSGTLSTFAGNGGSGASAGDGSAANGSGTVVSYPGGVTFDPFTDNVYIVEQGNHKIRYVDPLGTINTYAALAGTAGFSGDGGVAISAELNTPGGLDFNGRDRAVMVTDMANGCVREIGTTTPTPTSISGPTAVCVGFTIPLSLTAYCGTWSTANAAIATVDVNGNVTGVSAGNTDITYTVCCSGAILIKNINVTSPLIITTSTSTVCLGTSTSVTASGAATGYTWSPAGTLSSSTGATVVITPTSTATVYTVSGTNASGCVATSIFTVIASPTVTCTPFVICEEHYGDMHASGAVTYSWSPGAYLSATTGSSPTFTGPTTTVYTVTGTAANGCQHTVVTTAYVNLTPTFTLTPTSATICAGASTTFTATIDPGYIWTSSSSLSATTSGNWQTSDASIATIDPVTGVATGLSSGFVDIVYFYTTACGLFNYRTTLYVTAPNAGTISGLSSACVGGPSFSLSSSGDPGGTWSSSNTSVASINSSNMVYPLSIGVTDITYFVSGACGSDFSVLHLSVTAALDPGTISGATNACSGSASVHLTSTGLPGGIWTSSDATVASVVPASDILPISEGITLISYTVSAPGCNTASVSYPFTVNHAPNSGTITGVSRACVGSTVTFSTTGDIGGTWSSTNPGIASIDGAGNVFSNGVGTTDITYTVTSLYCGSAYSVVHFTVLPLPDPGTILSASSICAGGSPFSLVTSGTIGGVWNSSNPAVASIDGSGILIPGIVGTANITYTVTTASCGTAAVSYTFTVNALPSTTISDIYVCSTPGNLCAATTGGAGGYTYSWSPSSGLSCSTCSCIMINTVSGTSTSAYSVIATDANGCASTAVGNVFFNRAITGIAVDETFPFLLSGDAIFSNCGGSNILSVSVTSPTLTGATYTWSGPATIGSSAAAATTLNPTATATYSVTVSSNGCAGTKSISVVVPTAGTCSPCEAFKVNTYSHTSSGTASETSWTANIGACVDCGSVQPFHTITAGTVTATSFPSGSIRNIFYTPTGGTATFNGTISIADYVIFMKPNISIAIDPAASVTLSHCHLFSGATCGWAGISATGTSSGMGSLNVTNNTLIENVTTSTSSAAIKFAAGSITSLSSCVPSSYNVSTGANCYLNSDGAIYNYSCRGMEITYWPIGTSMPSTDAPIPFRIVNSVFTNRDLTNHNDITMSGGNIAANYFPFNWPSATDLKTVVTSSPDYDPNFVSDNYPVVTATNVGKYGLIFSGGLSTGTTHFCDLRLGDASSPVATHSNMFECMSSISISASSTSPAGNAGGGNLTAYNNIIRRMKAGGTTYGILVSQVNTDLSQYRLQVLGDGSGTTNGGNVFYNCSYAVRAVGANYDVIGAQSTIKSSNVLDIGTRAVAGALNCYPVPHTLISSALSNFGYSLNLNNFHTIRLRNNEIYNIPSGISLNLGANSRLANIGISSNTFSDQWSTATLTTASVSYSPYMNAAISVLNSSPSNAYDTITVDSNVVTIPKVISISQIGISLTSLTKINSLFSVSNNSVELSWNLSTNSVRGIKLTSVLTDNTATAITRSVTSNSVTGAGYNVPPLTLPATSSPVGTQAIYLNGVGNTSLSYGKVSVTCNYVGKTNIGFCAGGTNNLFFDGNIMDKNTCGLFLDASTIGEQGTTATPGNNYWANSSFWSGTKYHTYTRSVNPYTGTWVNSVLHVSTVTGYQPTNNGTFGGVIYSPGTSLILNTLEPTGPCAPTPSGYYAKAANNNEVAAANATDVSYTFFPNPSSGELTITQSDVVDGTVVVRVLNTLGASVYDGTLVFNGGATHLRLPDVAAGIYLVEITNTGGQRQISRIVVEK